MAIRPNCYGWPSAPSKTNGPVTAPKKPASAAALNAKPKGTSSKAKPPPAGNKPSPNSPSSTPTESTPTYDQNQLPYTKDLTGSQTLLSRYADPRKLLRIPAARLAHVVTAASHGQHGRLLADQLRVAAREAQALYAATDIDFAELAADIEAEVRFIAAVQAEIDQLDQRIQRLYAQADPDQILRSVPGVGATLAPTIHALFGDPHRFANLNAARAFTGLVPGTNQSGIGQAPTRPTKAGDPGLRTALFMAADLARQTDPTLAQRYRRLVVDRKLHHNSAICHLAAVLATRIIACLRSHNRYQIRAVDGRAINPQQARAICATLRVQPHERRPRQDKAGQTKKEVTKRLVA
jgi:hypothetical protein